MGHGANRRGRRMTDCKLCGESVPEGDAVGVVAAGMLEQTGVVHDVCFDNCEAASARIRERLLAGTLGQQRPLHRCIRQ